MLLPLRLRLPLQHTIAIGDIHGCSDALRSIIRDIDPQPEDEIVCLGDYVDKGLDSEGVIDQLIDLMSQCRLVPLLGNHDEVMLRAREDKASFRKWMETGGAATLESYGSSGQIDLIPDIHFQFLESCLPWFEIETHFFVHANYDPKFPLDEQDEAALRWVSLRDYVPGPHISGKIAVVGHTPQPNVLDLEHLICLDTGCAYDGKLTAMEMATGKLCQGERYSLTSVAGSRRISAPPHRKSIPMRYNVDLDLNPGLPSIISEYYGPHSFFDAKQTALARLNEWREESLAQIQEECPAEKLDGRKQELLTVFEEHHQTVSNWWRRDVDRKEQDAIAGPLSSLLQVLPRNRRQAVFAEIMEAVCRLDSADLRRLTNLIATMSNADPDAESAADYEL